MTILGNTAVESLSIETLMVVLGSLVRKIVKMR